MSVLFDLGQIDRAFDEAWRKRRLLNDNEMPISTIFEFLQDINQQARINLLKDPQTSSAIFDFVEKNPYFRINKFDLKKFVLRLVDSLQTNEPTLTTINIENPFEEFNSQNNLAYLENSHKLLVQRFQRRIRPESKDLDEQLLQNFDRLITAYKYELDHKDKEKRSLETSFGRLDHLVTDQSRCIELLQTQLVRKFNLPPLKANTKDQLEPRLTNRFMSIFQLPSFKFKVPFSIRVILIFFISSFLISYLDEYYAGID
ncbi:BA75_04692T0 [Komagataella pastoris]|uniref:BA75_04692T0 n=1 Tax=Komagataella pastoris TaxID=4922 RepID=A0A1B2JHX4_PICPA|nr:BA75_04692T0 [Komagataella pastoris]